jgi:hypothetical protein
MPTNRDPDDPTRAERTPFNIRADFRETDHSFRKRMDSMLPAHLADRVQKIITARFEENESEREAV